MRLITAASAIALFAAAVSPALAQEDYETRSETVRYGDLDPYNRNDAQVLLNRIERASDDVCNGSTSQSVAERVDDRVCAATATEDAVRDVGNPVLMAEYRGLDPYVVVEAEGDGYDPYDYPVKK